ncbi:hypothetical protein [Enterobacter hormaechei]|uniref:hypothetical protein n=1 Tax=Enterobacter hormaechei TaxID=158836 RepID=UPI003D6FA10A
MSRRHIFTERQRAALFDLPTDELSLLKFYTLGDDDLEALLQIVGGDKLIIPFC